MTAILFMDTETTGLSLEDDIWEFAAIRRERDGSECEHHMFIQHDTQRCNALPPSFLADHQKRFPVATGTGWHPAVVDQKTAAVNVHALTAGGVHIVGAVPNFDTERLAILLRRYGIEPGWHYHLIDVENLAVGYLYGKAAALMRTGDPSWAIDVPLPWDSDLLSRALGVEPPSDDVRHTALGDARWARDIYDAVMGTSTGRPTR